MKRGASRDRRSVVVALGLCAWVAANGVSIGRGQDTEAPATRAPATTAPEPDRWADARRLVARAEALFKVQNYEAALADYARAYDLLADYPKRYVVLHNLAVCNERLFRYAEAESYYERYLREGTPDAEERAAVLTSLASLSKLLASLHVDANVDAELWIDGRSAGRLPTSIKLTARRHLVEVRAPLHETERREIILEEGSTTRLDIQLVLLSRYRGPDRGYFFVSAGLTAALLVTGAVFGANALTAREQGLNHAGDSMNLRTSDLDRDQHRIRQWTAGTDIALGAAAVMGATTILLFFVTNWDRAEPAVTRPRAADEREPQAFIR
jgi:tetratricopeptide (TPR) repeat protein